MWKKIKDQTRQTEKWTPKGTEKNWEIRVRFLRMLSLVSGKKI